MGVPIADQATELSASRRMTYLQGRPSDLDIEEKPMMFGTKPGRDGEQVNGGALERCKGSPHYSHRAPWLRAVVLGANDGLVSITSLMLGVDAVIVANEGGRATIISGVAGLIAGACSMAIGEFVSVFSQRDSELADLEIERKVSAHSSIATKLCHFGYVLGFPPGWGLLYSDFEGIFVFF